MLLVQTHLLQVWMSQIAHHLITLPSIPGFVFISVSSGELPLVCSNSSHGLYFMYRDNWNCKITGHKIIRITLWNNFVNKYIKRSRHSEGCINNSHFRKCAFVTHFPCKCRTYMVDFKERKICLRTCVCLAWKKKTKKTDFVFFPLQSVVEMEAENRLYLTATET